MFFEVAGITAPLWLPPLAGFVLAFFCSMVGISGAFLLMPFQMSVLGYVAPSVSATNLVFNLVAIPSGVWRYAHEGRMDWPLARLIALGTLPGLLAGWWLRLHWLRRSAQLQAVRRAGAWRGSPSACIANCFSAPLRQPHVRPRHTPSRHAPSF